MVERAALVAIALAACTPAAAPQRSTLPPPPPAAHVDAPRAAGKPQVTWQRLESVADVPTAPPAPGSYRVHLIDVGTGLAILVQGHTWNLLYDGGTGDPGEKPLRVVAYLAAVLGASGDDQCVDPGQPAPTARRTIDHVVLSHPHLDHGSALDLVVYCFDVAHVWDSGRVNHAVFYRDFLTAVARSSTARYHTAASVPTDHVVGVKGAEIAIGRWERFAEGDRIVLDERAAFTILHAEAKTKPDPNQNSLVLGVELGGARMLLVGDAESGARKDPSADVGDIERFLLDHHREALRADILQVGHHGSKTSSRRRFLEAVQPALALVSSGPKQYHRVTLPDPEVLAELRRLGAEILRTDERDASCPLTSRLGGDRGPGGCDTYVITISPAP